MSAEACITTAGLAAELGPAFEALGSASAILMFASMAFGGLLVAGGVWLRRGEFAA